MLKYKTRIRHFNCLFFLGADGCGSINKPGRPGQALPKSTTDPPQPLNPDASTIKYNEPTNTTGSSMGLGVYCNIKSHIFLFRFFCFKEVMVARVRPTSLEVLVKH